MLRRGGGEEAMAGGSAPALTLSYHVLPPGMPIQVWANHLDQSVSQFLVSKTVVKTFPLVPISDCSSCELREEICTTNQRLAGKVTDKMNVSQLGSLEVWLVFNPPSQEGSQLFAHLGSVCVVRYDAHCCT